MMSVNLRKDISNLEISRLTNTLVSLAGEQNVFAFNVRKFTEDLSESLLLLYAASWIISLALFVMTFFQITVSVSSSLREDS